MAKSMQLNISGAMRKVKSIYINIGGTLRKVKKGFVNIGGVLREFFGGEPSYYGTATALSTARQNMGSTSFNNYAIFAGGNGPSGATNIVESYNSSLTRASRNSLSQTTNVSCGSSVSTHALFSVNENIVNAYSISFTRSIPSKLSSSRYNMASAEVGYYALFAGGKSSSSGSSSRVVDAYLNSSLTRTTASSLKTGCRTNGTHVGNYAIFAGGSTSSGYTDVANAYNTSLVKSNPTSLSSARGSIGTANIGNYAIFAGGRATSSTDVVDTYNQTLTRGTTIYLSSKDSAMHGATAGDFAIFAGETCTNAFDANLTRVLLPTLQTPRLNHSAASVGNYVLFAGGIKASDTSTELNSVEVYAV